MGCSMTSITLIVGLPGSGKSHLAAQMAQVEPCFVIDDIREISQLPDKKQLGSKRLVITDVNFCDHHILSNAIRKLEQTYQDTSIDVVYFENNPEKCRSNVAYRDDGRNVEGTISRFEKIYQPPENCKSIWTLDLSTEQGSDLYDYKIR